ncbi:MAG: single-stranded DNA-binding protein [Bacilli bacterium]
MNKVILIGRLTKDPELRYTQSNVAVATFSLAVNRNFSNAQGEREADFINIVVWRKQAENIKNYIKQGSQVAVDGRMQTRTYDGEDGKKRYITEVIAENVQFLDSKNSNQNNYQTPYTSSTPTVANNEPTPYDFKENNNNNTVNVKTDPFADFGENIEISDSDLPF